MPMTPTPGRIVEYTLNAADAASINMDRKTGTRLATGNEVHEGQSYPMVIVRVWSATPNFESSVNGQVFLDGTDTYWATSRQQDATPPGEGDGRGKWREYPRV